ncbi:circularly permuted type 2 ATP-grasp protein [Marinobacterium sp. LSUCC0821]|uniref:circularly permuted type 2 ATP-grasp protein n=1 Tax=Marinobacterium sp. LSUCC0821 TaxID=2668067 RepID=UPI0014520833|nr:circularly permuted type 2 ATP-grasp protein [Marinobacterium sp. LSUCC0821]QJD70998.1 circularly permuted type 2 ATP-grasp protein [Marinobacterium sp. LSUCC0821]
MVFDWSNYCSPTIYDELIDANCSPRPAAQRLISYMEQMSPDELNSRKQMADATIRELGVSFTVYTDEGNIDRAWPFDIIPRVIDWNQWKRTEQGLKQRLTALNMFINDLYNDQNILNDGVVPRDLIENSKNFRRECMGIKPAHGVWAHICGTDLVRDQDGEFYVLEDNLRVPSGVSYMLENRAITKRVLPEVFQKENIRPVDDYTSELLSMLNSVAPTGVSKPTIVVLTPGIYNSAYFEHAYLAQQMGVELVEGTDLFVDASDTVYMRTIAGPIRVDVIYRRIDDEFIDPEVFREDSILGVPGLMRAWKSDKVALVNAPGAGVADDKVIYAYVPAIIKYYLNEEPLINNVETYLCSDPEQREYVLANLEKLVVKPANESGGYGMLVGPHSTPEQIAEFDQLIRESPRNYIAQPTLSLSTAPTIVEENAIEGRHLDLRPFILQGKDTYVTTGGLTRVAMKKGSLVVNSSQGGGSKDTWIVDLGNA